MSYCEKCEKYGIKQSMNKKELEPLEVKKKLMHNMEFTPILYRLVYEFYDYFECPICHWFKFKRKNTQSNTGENTKPCKTRNDRWLRIVANDEIKK